MERTIHWIPCDHRSCMGADLKEDPVEEGNQRCGGTPGGKQDRDAAEDEYLAQPVRHTIEIHRRCCQDDNQEQGE